MRLSETYYMAFLQFCKNHMNLEKYLSHKSIFWGKVIAFLVSHC